MAAVLALPPGLTPAMVGEAGQASAEQRAKGCTNPVRIKGSTKLVNTTTGEVAECYSSARELDGHTYVRCGNRRVWMCESCGHEYKGDAWHLILSGLAGGKGVPASVAEHPCTFVTLTAPSFGAVHGLRQKGPCRARRDRPMCPHGRPLSCGKRHHRDDPDLGTPLCWECYDYLSHVMWQWNAPELWRRFTIALQRELAKKCGISVTEFRRRCKISYAKITEFQARGVIHVHAPIRLDGPDGPGGEPLSLPLSTEDLEKAVHRSARKVTVDTAPLSDGLVCRLHWGAQVDARSINGGTDRDSDRRVSLVHPEQVAAYLAKYLTKATEDFGLPMRVLSTEHARLAGASEHAVRIIETAEWLAGEGESYERLSAYLAMLGYGGHPITKSRAYSVTFGRLRRSRRVFARNPGLDPDADIREVLDDLDVVPEGFELVSSWELAGHGYLTLDQAARAVMSAALSRSRRLGRHNPAASR